jgi:hypothetical protein
LERIKEDSERKAESKVVEAVMMMVEDSAESEKGPQTITFLTLKSSKKTIQAVVEIGRSASIPA